VKVGTRITPKAHKGRRETEIERTKVAMCVAGTLFCDPYLAKKAVQDVVYPSMVVVIRMLEVKLRIDLPTRYGRLRKVQPTDP
jgi:hypothetical protein